MRAGLRARKLASTITEINRIGVLVQALRSAPTIAVRTLLRRERAARITTIFSAYRRVSARIGACSARIGA